MPLSKEITNLMKEMENNLKDTINESLKKQEKLFTNKLDQISSNLKLQAEKIESIIESQNLLNAEFEIFKKDVSELKKLKIPNKIESLEKRIEILRNNLNEQEKCRDDLEQVQRRDNLEFHGIPQIQNENTNFIIKSMAKKLNIDLKDEDISTSHRLPSTSNNHPIIVARFTSRDIRNNIYQKRKNLIGVRNFEIAGMEKLYINENLTPRRRKLFSMAHKKKTELKYSFLWTKNGNIFMRKNNASEKIKISCEDDIDKLN